jgi:CubicO group peptidase (beta-lactamase class C family)
LSYAGKAQLYFPPITGSVWDTLSPASLGWCPNRIDSLYHLLDTNNTRAFILLKQGKIVLEKYFNGHTASANWYWASAGKTLTALMTGIAQQENYLSITDTTSKYLGQGWTSCTPAQEQRITIRHQLTMTSGLDDGVADPYCTVDTCLHYLADAGTRWAYHNAPYTLLDSVIENATGKTLNVYTTQKLKNLTGMDGVFLKQGFNNLFVSTARSMARFGLLMLNKGNWNGSQILQDTAYFNAMVNTSQNLNLSYGYLWWLNGKSSYMIPQTQFVFNGSMNPHAPNDMIAAMGKNGQFINVVPSQDMVWIRMGDAPDTSSVPFTFNDRIWQYINKLSCTTSVHTSPAYAADISVYPNPATETLFVITNRHNTQQFRVRNSMGQVVSAGQLKSSMDLSGLPSGVYLLTVFDSAGSNTVRFTRQ